MKCINNIIIINLERDKKRRKYIIDHVKSNLKNVKIHLIKAIDGRILKQNKNYTMNHIACSMSHLKAWNYILENNITDFFIVEDDVIFKNNFLEKLNTYLKYLPKNWSMIYFGYFGLANYKGNHYLIEKLLFSLPKLGLNGTKNNYSVYNKYYFTAEFPLGLHCYTININYINLLKKAFTDIYTVPDVQLADYFANNKISSVYCTV